VTSEWDHYKQLADQSIKNGDYSDAESLWFAALQTVAFDSESDPRLPLTLDGLANACALLRKYSEAERLYWDSIKIKEKYCGFDSMETAASIKGLAAVYYEQSQFAESESLAKRVLKIIETVKGRNDEYVETAMNLSMLCQKQKKFDEAQLFYQQALEANGIGERPKISTPFGQATIKPTSMCPVCKRTFVGENCMLCTQTTVITTPPKA
jgi:tetratricopeptide (TPR) repeat protein